MVGYRVGNTLSDSGTVSRGICETDSDGKLTKVVERTTIEHMGDKIGFTDENGEVQYISATTPVSMNMWGFTPDYFDLSEREFVKFLSAEINTPKSECVIPRIISPLVANGTVSVKVLDTPSVWFGVTYAADRQGVVDKIASLIAKGEYPAKLF